MTQRVAVQILLRGRPEVGHDMPAMTGRRSVLLASCARLQRRDLASPPVVVGVTIGATNLYAPVPWPWGSVCRPWGALGAHDNTNSG